MIVNSNNQLSKICAPDLSFLEIEVEATVTASQRVRLDLPVIDFQVSATGQIPGACDLDISLIGFEITGRIGDEPNVFGVCALELNALEISLAPNLNQNGLSVVDLNLIDFEVNPSVREFETSELQFVCDILPVRPTALVREFAEKLTVGGIEIKISSWNYDEAADRTGATLNVTLLNPADGAEFSNYTSIKFETGEKISGVWEWETLVDSASPDASNFTFGRTGDTFTFSCAGDLNAKLNKTAATDLVIYDSNRITLAQDDFEPTLDTDGREYKTQLVPQANLKLSGLFNRIFIERCGFSSVRSNLPDYPVSRLDFEPGASYYDALKGVIGQFDPLTFENSGELHIIDATAVLPAGFPAPRTVTISKTRALAAESSRGRLDAFRVVYTEDERNFDYITYELKTYTESSGTFGTDDYTETDFEIRYREYRKFAQPAIVLSKKLERKRKSVYNSHFLETGETIERYTYDAFGDNTKREKTVAARVPDLANNGNLTIMTVREEKERFDFAPHPFAARKRYLKRRELRVAGLITIDAENRQLDEDFERDISVAYRSGNIIPEMTTRYGAIKTERVTSEPLRNGNVRVAYWEYDHLSGLVIRDDEEEVPGEIGTSAFSSSQNKIYVFDADNAARSTERIETFNAGELPLTHAVPLARRVLKKRKTKPLRLSMELTGRDTTIKKGTAITAAGREGNVIGTFLIEGRSLRGSREGRFMTLTGRQI